MTASQDTRRRSAAWRAVRRAAGALRHIHREQALMWELWWQANRASAPSTGPLRWFSPSTVTGWLAAMCQPRTAPLPGMPHEAHQHH